MARYHILIVDDQRDVRLLLRTSLETLKLDLEIIDVPSAEEALLVLGKEQIDLMVVDIRLPGMSGLELHDRAGKRTPTTQLILITGLTDEKIQRQVAEAGAVAYFYKPIQIGHFLDVVRDCLGIRPTADINPQKSQSISPPLPVLSTLASQFGEFCVQQGALRGKIMSAQREIVYDWDNSDAPKESPIPEELMMGLLEQDLQNVQSLAGIAFPCHHLFSRKEDDLWITCLQPELVASVLLPKGMGVQKATVLLSVINKLHAGTMNVGLERNEPKMIEEDNRVEVDEGFDGEFSALLGQAAEHGLRTDDLEAFWDHLNQEDQTIQTGHGVLTYEEALRMGLAKGGQIP